MVTTTAVPLPLPTRTAPVASPTEASSFPRRRNGNSRCEPLWRKPRSWRAPWSWRARLRWTPTPAAKCSRQPLVVSSRVHEACRRSGRPVRKGEVLAYVVPSTAPLERSVQAAQLAELRRARALAERRLARLKSLSDTVPRKDIEAAEAELASLGARASAVDAGLTGREALVAPVAGVIACVQRGRRPGGRCEGTRLRSRRPPAPAHRGARVRPRARCQCGRCDAGGRQRARAASVPRCSARAARAGAAAEFRRQRCRLVEAGGRASRSRSTCRRGRRSKASRFRRPR